MITNNKSYSKNLVFYAACVGMIFFGVVLISLGTVLPDITAKFDLNELEASSVVLLLPLGVLAGSVVFGPVVDRFGYKVLLIFSSLFSACGLALLGYAGSVFVLRLAVFVAGFFGGILNGETNTIVSDISDNDRNSKLSFLAVFFGVGALGVPFVMRILKSYFSFEIIIAAIAAIMLLFTATFLFIRFPMPKQPQGFPVKEGLKLLKQPVLLLLSLVLFFQSGIEGLTNNWTTTYFEKIEKTSPETALLALTLMMAGMTVGRMTVGIILKKVRSYKIVFAGCAIIITGILILFFVPGAALAGITLFGLGFAPVFPVILGYIGTIYPDLSGTAFSIAFFIALIGNTSMNFLMGVFARYLGMGVFPVILFISVLILSFIFSFVLNKTSLKVRIK
ncbi:MAG TPA: MFS transporter [Bacteroidales bacterium]|nr:MFS transporter [Bacteroidales bacterium]